ncbi:MAG: 1-(5-phosphoribosyl)-5-[(5-phosphoribosylamino)methylideneamino]imidazole-4-carboxamide isomerase [Ginsengibacter sp.]
MDNNDKIDQDSLNSSSPLGDRGKDLDFIIPAIDIINGNCVRLSKGDYSKQITYHDDPVQAAKIFENAGFRRLHIVDLDGAKAGSIKNLNVLENISTHTNLNIDFGGGIKSINDISSVFNAGASVVTLGSIAAKNPAIIEEWIMEFGSAKILIGADVLNEKIKISGWIKDAGIIIFEFVGKMLASGVQNIFCTDISKDGMMKGPSVDLYKKILSSFSDINLIASGGVATIEDVILLKEIGCHGVIIGKAIYEGKIKLKDLIKLN